MVSVCWCGRRDDVFCLWTVRCWIVLECHRCARMQASCACCEKRSSACLRGWGARSADTYAGGGILDLDSRSRGRGLCLAVRWKGRAKEGRGRLVGEAWQGARDNAVQCTCNMERLQVAYGGTREHIPRGSEARWRGSS